MKQFFKGCCSFSCILLIILSSFCRIYVWYFLTVLISLQHSSYLKSCKLVSFCFRNKSELFLLISSTNLLPTLCGCQLTDTLTSSALPSPKSFQSYFAVWEQMMQLNEAIIIWECFDEVCVWVCVVCSSVVVKVTSTQSLWAERHLCQLDFVHHVCLCVYCLTYGMCTEAARIVCNLFLFTKHPNCFGIE